MLSAEAIVSTQDHWTTTWHLPETAEAEGIARMAEDAREFMVLVAQQHQSNFVLWHTEDEARTPGASDAAIADVKRRIDKVNQERNDLAEELDRRLLAFLESSNAMNLDAALNSESPGLMIDRLSILSLKIYHTREEARRTDAAPGHAERNQVRLAVLEDQRADLAGCLDALWSETLAGRRRFKIYRQMKMYNDPELNPAIYLKR